jgi:hypothetical protein
MLQTPNQASRMSASNAGHCQDQDGRLKLRMTRRRGVGAERQSSSSRVYLNKVPPAMPSQVDLARARSLRTLARAAVVSWPTWCPGQVPTGFGSLARRKAHVLRVAETERPGDWWPCSPGSRNPRWGFPKGSFTASARSAGGIPTGPSTGCTQSHKGRGRPWGPRGCWSSERGPHGPIRCMSSGRNRSW